MTHELMLPLDCIRTCSELARLLKTTLKIHKEPAKGTPPLSRFSGENQQLEKRTWPTTHAAKHPDAPCFTDIPSTNAIKCRQKPTPSVLPGNQDCFCRIMYI